jgi:hypothetical protein
MGYDMYLVAPSAEDLAIKEVRGLAVDEAIFAREAFVNQTIMSRQPTLKGPVRMARREERHDWRFTNREEWDWSGLSEQEATNFHAAARALRQNDPGYRAQYDQFQAAVEKAVEVLDPTYFRLNIWGMSQFAHLMGLAGMLNNTRAPELRYQDFNIPLIINKEGQEEEDYESVQYQTWKEQYLGFTSQGPGIPRGKIQAGNEGWLVLPSECESALTIWATCDDLTKQYIRAQSEISYDESFPDPDNRRRVEQGLADRRARVGGEITVEPYEPDALKYYWDAWLAFIERAVSRGGFEVD